MHAKSGGSSGEPPDFLFIPAACRSRKDLPRSAGGGGRARNTGNRPRDAEDGATGTGRRRRGCGATGPERRAAGPRVRVRVRDAEHGTRKTRAWGAGRKTRNAEHVKRGRGHGGTGCRTQDAGRRTRATGRGQQNTGNAGTGRRRRGTSPRAWTAARLHTPARPRNNLPGPFTAGRLPPRAAATCRAYESESRRCRRARRTCCCRAAPRPT